MRTIFTFSFLLAFCLFTAKGQITPLWTSQQSGIGDNSDRFNAVVRNATGDLYLGGYTFNTGQDKDYLVVKMSGAGDTVWTRQFNGADNGSDKILYMALDASGNVIVTGESDGGGINQNDILTIKYSPDGAILWSTIYNNSAIDQDDQPLGLSVDNSGNVFITGSSDRDAGSGVNDDILTIKYNSSGVQQWAAVINGLGNGTDRGNAVNADNEGGCLITGRTLTSIDDDVITIKYNSTGSETWRVTYNRGFGNDRGQDIVNDGSGNIYVTGRSENANDYDVVTIKYNASGVSQWTKFYNNVDNDYGNRIKVNTSGEVFVVGQTDVNSSGGTTNYDFVTLKYNSSGIQQWAKTFGNAALNDEDPNDLLIDGLGNVYVTGKSDVNALASVTANNYLTLKYSAAGILLWSGYYSGTEVNSDDIAEGFAMDETNGILYVAGGSQNTITQKDATVIKYTVAGGTQSWAKSYNGKGEFTDKVQAIISDSKKNIFITGYIFVAEQRKDLFVARLNPAGSTVWFRTYDFAQDNDEGKAITLDPSGNVYVCGNSIGNGTSDDYITIKFDSLGNTLWTARYNFANEADVAASIGVNPSNGNVFVTGYSDSDPSSASLNYDITTIKYSPIGNESGVVRFNGTGNGIDRGVKIIVIGTNEYVTGKSWNGLNYDAVTLKYNGTLLQQWLKIYSGSANKDDEPRDMVSDGSNIYIAGNTGTASHGDDCLLIKYNNSGIQQWVSTYNDAGNYSDIAYAAALGSNAVFITGRSAPSATGDTADMVTIKFNVSDGLQTWVNKYNGSNGLDRGNAIALDQFGNVYASGESVGSSATSDFATILYDGNGARKWIARYNGTANGEDVARAMVIDASGYLYAAGYSAATGAGLNAVTLKYCPPPPANSGSDVAICSGSSTTLNGSGGMSYSWSPTTGLSSATTANPVANPASTTSYILTVDNGLGCSASDTVKVTVNSLPKAIITASGPLQFCQGDSVIFTTSQGAGLTYQWMKGANNIGLATNSSYTAKSAGTYKVKVTGVNGCSKLSKGKKVTITCKENISPTNQEENTFEIAASPNPFTQSFTINIATGDQTAEISIFNILGQRVYHTDTKKPGLYMLGNDLIPGVYIVRVTVENNYRELKVIKTND